MSSPRELLVAGCATCHSRFLPRAGPCPRCGSKEVTPHAVPGQGVVLAAVELESPAAGWTAPHRLVLLELAEAVRLLALAADTLPEIGSTVAVERDGELYRVRPTSGGPPAKSE